MKSKEPEKIELSDQDVERLEKGIQGGNLSAQDQALLITVLKWSRWVSMLLQLKTLNLKRLRRLIFGARTEKDAPKGDKKDKDKKDPPTNAGAASDDKKGKGRNTPADYKGAKRLSHQHESLRPGQECPQCARGTLYQYKTSSFITFIGQAPIQATRHDCQVLRCSACQGIFWPKAVDGLRRRKWGESVAATLAVMHYWMGVPFSRLERLQDLGGMPLPKSTQWDLLEGLARPAFYVYQALKKYLADVKLVYNDDTPARILSVMAEVKGRPVKKKKERRGTFTTALVGVREGHKVSLFVTGRKHAGENLKDLVGMRGKGLGPIMTMNDAAARAMPRDLLAQICNCLTHGRRNFHELLEDCPREAGHVLKLLSYTYRADALARRRGYNENERLSFLQKKSGKAMRDLWRWCHKMLARKKVEPNSVLGGAIRYMLKHWKRLTKFLTVPGAPLDNNICERLVKVMIRYRKNSLFFKTENGALVGDILMSLIQTCLEAGVDAFHYLESILKNKALAKSAPENWFPWNYTANLTKSPA